MRLDHDRTSRKERELSATSLPRSKLPGLGLNSGATDGLIVEAILPDQRAAAKSSSWRLKPMDMTCKE